MNMNTLIKKVTRETQSGRFDEAFVSFSRSGNSEAFEALRRSTKIELEKVRDQLSRLVPNDFDYSVFVESGRINFTLEFMDGLETCANSGLNINLMGDYVKQLLDTDWDYHRVSSLKMTEIVDDLSQVSENLDGALPPTSEIQLKHAKEIESFILKVEKLQPKFAMLVYCDSLSEYEEVFHEERSRLLGDITDFLTFRDLIICIVDKSKILSVEDTDEIKLEVLNGLSPISKAKALGQTGAAMKILMS